MADEDDELWVEEIPSGRSLEDVVRESLVLRMNALLMIAKTSGTDNYPVEYYKIKELLGEPKTMEVFLKPFSGVGPGALQASLIGERSVSGLHSLSDVETKMKGLAGIERKEDKSAHWLRKVASDVFGAVVANVRDGFPEFRKTLADAFGFDKENYRVRNSWMGLFKAAFKKWQERHAARMAEKKAAKAEPKAVVDVSKSSGSSEDKCTELTRRLQQIAARVVAQPDGKLDREQVKKLDELFKEFRSLRGVTHDRSTQRNIDAQIRVIVEVLKKHQSVQPLPLTPEAAKPQDPPAHKVAEQAMRDAAEKPVVTVDVKGPRPGSAA